MRLLIDECLPRKVKFLFAEGTLAETFRGARNLNHGARNLKYRLRFVGSGQTPEVCRNCVVRCTAAPEPSRMRSKPFVSS